MNTQPTIDAHAWDGFLAAQRFRPFLQSWTMGEVYRDIAQEPVRLCVHGTDGRISAICLGIVVAARRGKHIAVQYGPIVADALTPEARENATREMQTLLQDAARKHGCTFIRMSPFAPVNLQFTIHNSLPSPLHLLAEHVWYLPLVTPDPWSADGRKQRRTEEELLAPMRKTTRNLIRRAEKDGVTVTASPDPVRDVEEFIRLHDETRKRHKFTPYSNRFFRAQVARFAPRNECTVYLARYQDQVIAASIHMHVAGETGYHHGASASAFHKVPASYLIQWTAIRDALTRGDHIYNFWGIAPLQPTSEADGSPKPLASHPFAGVTLFKTGFGGELLNLQHCTDIPLSPMYRMTRFFEQVRKWRRGF